MSSPSLWAIFLESGSRPPTMNEPIKIRGEMMPDPAMCTFHLPTQVIEAEWSVGFQRGDPVDDSPLIEGLFDLDGIEHVRVSGSELIVTKRGDTPWTAMAALIVPVVRKALGGDAPAVSESAVETVRNAPPSEIAPLVERLFESHINPALASHGGHARLVKVEDRDVYLEMGGGCQGCTSSQATLRKGIEMAIRQAVPHVREVIDVTDHTAGANPYYT